MQRCQVIPNKETGNHVPLARHHSHIAEGQIISCDVIYCYLAGLGALLQGRTKVVLREFAAYGGSGVLGHDEGLDGLKTAESGNKRTTWS